MTNGLASGPIIKVSVAAWLLSKCCLGSGAPATPNMTPDDRGASASPSRWDSDSELDPRTARRVPLLSKDAIHVLLPLFTRYDPVRAVMSWRCFESAKCLHKSSGHARLFKRNHSLDWATQKSPQDADTPATISIDGFCLQFRSPVTGLWSLRSFLSSCSPSFWNCILKSTTKRDSADGGGAEKVGRKKRWVCDPHALYSRNPQ